MAELKIGDFLEMLSTSNTLANELAVSTEELRVEIVDEEGDIYDIQNVSFNVRSGSILIKFNHDNEDENEEEEWVDPNPPFPSLQETQGD